MRLRWPDAIHCVSCGGVDVSERARHRGRRAWRCVCGKDFTVTTGNALHASKLPLTAWEAAARSPDDSPSGLQALLAVSAVTARRVSRVLRSLPAAPGEARLVALVSTPRDRLEDNPTDTLSGMPESQRRVLSALRVMLGGAPASAIARFAGLSASHVRRCLLSLEEAGFVQRSRTHIRWGYGRRKVTTWDMAVTPQTIAALKQLTTSSIEPQPAGEINGVPPEHWGVFWSGTSAAELRLPDDALHIADTMVGGPSTRARNWALSRLPLATLRQLRTMRGYEDGPNADLLDSTIRVRSHARD